MRIILVAATSAALWAQPLSAAQLVRTYNIEATGLLPSGSPDPLPNPVIFSITTNLDTSVSIHRPVLAIDWRLEENLPFSISRFEYLYYADFLLIGNGIQRDGIGCNRVFGIDAFCLSIYGAAGPNPQLTGLFIFPKAGGAWSGVPTIPGYEATLTFTDAPVVPEPAIWAMLLVGFGFMGAAIRAHKRRQKLTVIYS